MKHIVWCWRQRLRCWWRRYHAWVPTYQWVDGDLTIACQDCCVHGFVDFHNWSRFSELHESSDAAEN